MKRYEIVDHTADWALRVFGPDLGQLLINAALGMASLQVESLDEIPLTLTQRIELDAYDAEGLLVDWLTELAYVAETDQILFKEFQVDQITSTHLRAAARGGPVAELQKHIKAVTYHDLAIVQTENGLEATVVFDV